MMFGDKLRLLREAKGWSQKQLADASGVAQSAIAKWEIGVRDPAFGNVHRLCKALGVKCTVFDGCDFGEADQKRGRGRPKKN